MYLHIGNKKNVREKNIIGIFDMDNTTVSAVTRAFLSRAEKDGRMSTAVEEIPKSFVVSADVPQGKKEYIPPVGKRRKKVAWSVCMSPLLPTSLNGRMNDGDVEHVTVVFDKER